MEPSSRTRREIGTLCIAYAFLENEAECTIWGILDLDVPIPTIPGSRSDPFRAPVPGDPGQRFQSNPGSPDGSGDSVTIFVG